MIQPAEIEAKAREYEIHPSDVQKDYVFGWILFTLFTSSALKDRLFLKGGNALRKGYFSNTRYSADLDFGIPDDISEDELRRVLDDVCERAKTASGVEFLPNDTKVREKFSES